MTVLTVLGILVGAVVLLLAGFVAWIYTPSRTFEREPYKPVRPDYWPTEGFRTSTPEAQGMDSARLVEMVKAYQADHARHPENAIDSIAIIRNGYLVADLYFDPLYPPETKHAVHSAAKSVLSALIGIAIEQGHIAGVDVPILSFFEDQEVEIKDERMRAVTLRHLLTMQTGVRSRDSYIYRYDGLFGAMEPGDWYRQFLALPVDAEPGTRFDYSNLAYFMASVILERATGMDPVTYAQANLFEPLGIEDVRWETHPRGPGLALAPMWIRPHDMVKFGLLYLQQGRWEGRQVVPADWVAASITPYAYPRNYVDVLDERGKKDSEASRIALVSNRILKPFADGYGYMWWLDRQGTYNALGTAGQYLIVAPAQNLVVMITNSSSGTGVFFPGKLFRKYILPAVAYDGAIAAQPQAQHELVALSRQPSLVQETQPVAPLPATALTISGATYSLDANRWHYDDFRLDFDPSADTAAFSYTTDTSGLVTIQLGLDGVYRFSETPIGTFAATGAWVTQDSFEVAYQQIGYSAPTTFRLTFGKDQVSVTEVSVTGSMTYAGHVRSSRKDDDDESDRL